MDSGVKVKAKYKGTSRRFEIQSSITWQELSAKLSTLFNFTQDFCLKYCDDENELVLISSQEELDEALKLYQKKPGLLNLFIEDPSAPRTTDNTLLNLEKRNDQGKKKEIDSCYAKAASSLAPEFAAMNARLQYKKDEEAKQTNKPAVSLDDDQTESEVLSVTKKEEIVHSKYVDFSEVMAQTKQQEQSSQQNTNRNENGTSRGWFNDFENQRQQQQSKHGNGKSKKNKNKKKNCYCETASTIASQLASIKVKGPPERTSFAVPCETFDTDVSEPTSVTSLSVSSPPPEISRGNMNNAADFNQQQMIQSGQQRVLKRPKRSKKHGKKKSCYAQAALDIAPLYQAMNDRLKEQQQNSQDTVSLNDDSGEDMPAEDSPSTESESFVFVNSSDGEPFSIEVEQTEMVEQPRDNSLTDDVVEDGPSGHSSQPPPEQPSEQPSEQHMDSESSEGGRRMNENVTENPKDINVAVKEVIEGSLDFIVEQTVQRMQKLKVNQSSQVPNDEASSNTDVEEKSKVVHKGITCDYCRKEIQGVRYKCCNCRDYDLCDPCETKDIHDMDHVFVKLKFQAPGIGRRHGEMVPIFKNSVYKKENEKKLRKAAKNAEKEKKRAAYKQLKHALRAQEKERKREEKHLGKQELMKSEQQPTDPRARKMAKVYEKLKMEYIHDASIPDGSVVSPGQKFLKTWVIRNVGTIAWNQWIKLECIEGGIMVTPGRVQGHVPHLGPGMQGEVSVEFIAPEPPGTYSSKWHLTYGLHTFGPQLWCEIVVAVPNNADKETPVQYDQTTLVNSAFIKDTPFLEDTKLQAASYLIVDDGSGSEYHSSEETPETQQGRERIAISDVPQTSMEAQQRQDLEWDAGCVHDVEVVDVSADNEESFNLINLSGAEEIARSNNSEGKNIIVITELSQSAYDISDKNLSKDSTRDSDDEGESDSSLDEFTVLIPPCFDPDTPLSADPVPVKVGYPKRSGSFSSKYLPRSFEPYLNLDDNNEPSSLPTMSSSERVASFENLARNTDEPTKVQSAPVLAPDAVADQGEETPSGSISPIEISDQRSTQTQPPISRQSRVTPGETVPLVVSYPQTIADKAHSYDGRNSNGESPLPTNVVSDVLSSAIDVVANAGRAAIATVDNLFSGSVQASATYKPEDNCEVTVDRRSNTSGFDAPPPIVNRPPGDNPMSHLIEMGFADRRLNQQLLKKHNNDLRATVDELLSHTENDWSSQRH